MNSAEQRTEEWLRERLGHVTGSQISKALAKKGTGTREDYLWQLVGERESKQIESGYTNTAMQRGIEMEPIARAAYEAHTGHFVDQIGFVKHPTIEWFGASPDGLVGEDGLVEIKCPNTSNHLQYRKSGKPPAKYKYQMMAQLACTGRKWCDFVSFDNRVRESWQLFIVRFEPEAKAMEAMLKSVQEFLDEVKRECE